MELSPEGQPTRKIEIVGIVLCILGPILVIISIFLIIWYDILNQHYTRTQLKPGQTYHVGSVQYRMPHLPMRKHRAYKLRDGYMQRQRALLRQVSNLFARLNIQYCLFMGTLLGFIRHQTLIPWDDDLDLLIPITHYRYLRSPAFACILQECRPPLEILVPRRDSKSPQFFKIKFRGERTPFIDLFFAKETSRGIIECSDVSQTSHRKLLPEGITLQQSSGSWYTTCSLYPVRTLQCDGFTLRVPNDPEAVLRQDYGVTALTVMIPPSLRYVNHNIQSWTESILRKWRLNRCTADQRQSDKLSSKA